MLAQRGVDDAHVEEDLGCVGDLLELLQRLVELIVVVAPQGGDPGFYFLWRMSVGWTRKVGPESLIL